jgi:hypothetical protein
MPGPGAAPPTAVPFEVWKFTAFVPPVPPLRTIVITPFIDSLQL